MINKKIIVGVRNKDADAKKELILNEFDTPDPGSDPVATKLTDEDLTQAAHTAVFALCQHLPGQCFGGACAGDHRHFSVLRIRKAAQIGQTAAL